jgi:hypothetical protein
MASTRTNEELDPRKEEGKEGVASPSKPLILL